jgi:predicted bacteriocin transport accessory protein
MKRILLLSLCMVLCGCQAQQTQTTSKKACDATTVEEECSTSSTSSASFTEISFDDAITYFTEGKSGVLFFGFESCPWCKEAKPILKKVAKKLGVDIYYVKTRDDDKNLLYTDEQKAQIQPYIQDYMSNNDEGVLTLYVPLVLTIKDGKVTAGHEGTLDSHDATERKMTKKEKKKLTRIYNRLLKETQSN